MSFIIHRKLCLVPREWLGFMDNLEVLVCKYFFLNPIGYIILLDPEVQEAIKPIYEDLSRYELLDRCKGNNTENNNESYNGLLWHFSPKHLHNGFKTIELSNNFATAIFNDGYSSILKIFNVMGVIVGPCARARDFAALKDDTRIRIADHRQRASSKEGRSSRRKASSAKQALFEEEEGELYGPGIAD
ncbi:unnamed protein product [Euphydryas editha]|uniref:Uncharacterized protein n=1 Tax=Euphydryas editha TaxID=104508 RepID=A0AAU9TTW6_EUPED|nr:unnamed protein product [Euphydryas editha]